MALEYRNVPDDRREEFHDLLHYAFSLEDGHADYDPEEDSDEVGVRRGLFDGDDLVVICRHYWFDARVRGSWVPAPGLSAVASPPEHRHEGYISRLLEESLAEYRERGSVLSVLWPFKYSFYRKYGWETCSRFSKITCEPGHLEFLQEDAKGEFRRATPDDWATLDEIYEAAADHDLAIDRSEAFWRHRVFEGWRKDPFVYVWEDDGEPGGYVVYAVENDDDGKTFQVRDLAAVDETAFRNCLRFLYYHESQVEKVSIRGLPDAQLLDRLPEQWAVDCEVSRGPMARIVDIPAAVEALEYPKEIQGTVRMAVEDPLVEWNEGTFELSFADGRATCRRVEDDPAVTFPVATLSQLYVGYRSLDRLRRETDVVVHDEAVTDPLERAYPPRDVFLREGF
ncbi:MAG: putative acetyltransferase [Natronomonas sp.]|jgi:predicted acetyltransferase